VKRTGSNFYEFNIGSNVAYVRLPTISTAQVLAAQTFASQIAQYDRLLAGNSAIGLQYLKVTSTEVLANAAVANVAARPYYANAVSFDGNTDIDSISNFIRVANSTLQS